MHVCRVCEYCTVTALQRETEHLWILLSKSIPWNENKRSSVIPATTYRMTFFFTGVSWEKKRCPIIIFMQASSPLNHHIKIIVKNKIFLHAFWCLLSVRCNQHWHSAANLTTSQVLMHIYLERGLFQRGYTLLIVCQWWKYWNTTATPNQNCQKNEIFFTHERNKKYHKTIQISQIHLHTSFLL